MHSEALLIYDFVKKIEIIHSEIVSFSPVSEGEKLGVVGVWGEWGGGDFLGTTDVYNINSR